MKRPGPVGLTILLVFTIVAAIEFRTLLGMFGIEVATGLYYPIAAAVIVLFVAALLLISEDEPTQASKV